MIGLFDFAREDNDNSSFQLQLVSFVSVPPLFSLPCRVSITHLDLKWIFQFFYDRFAREDNEKSYFQLQINFLFAEDWPFYYLYIHITMMLEQWRDVHESCSQLCPFYSTLVNPPNCASVITQQGTIYRRVGVSAHDYITRDLLYLNERSLLESRLERTEVW